jgi:gamma-glutamyl hydrolase
MMLLLLSLWVASVSSSSSSFSLSLSSPVIGILTQPIVNSSDTMVAASYVKWLEAGGARSIPIPYDAPPTMVQELFYQVNGILFPGGASAVPDSAREIWRMVHQAANRYHRRRPGDKDNDEGEEDSSRSSPCTTPQNDFFPLWGTCLGFEYLIQLAASASTTTDSGVLDSDYVAENISLPLYEVQQQYQLYHDPELFHAIQTKNITMNNHHQGIPPQRFRDMPELTRYWNITSINYDANGKPFVSTIEPRHPTTFPVYGVQYHPEKNAFEYATYPHSNIPYEAIDHSPSGISMSLYMAQFLVKLSRKNQEQQEQNGCRLTTTTATTIPNLSHRRRRGGSSEPCNNTTTRATTSTTSCKVVCPQHEYTKVDKYPLIYSYPMKRGIQFEQQFIIPPASSWEKEKEIESHIPLKGKSEIVVVI